MKYEQTYLPDYKKPYIGGWCENYVEQTAGQGALTWRNGRYEPTGVWQNAVAPVNQGETAAWAANYKNGNHPGDQPPKGLRVPVFFKLGSTPAGHVALALEDGRVASSSLSGRHESGFIYPSLQALIDDYAKYNNGCEYLGWSEYIGKQQVVKGVTMEPFNEGDRLNKNLALYGVDKGRFKFAVGKPYKEADYAIMNSDEFKEDALINKGDIQNLQDKLGIKLPKDFVDKTSKELLYALSLPNAKPQDDQAAKDKLNQIKEIVNQ